MKYTLLTNGKIVNNRLIARGDLLIGNNRIMQVGGRINAPTPETTIINVKNKYLLPGLIHYNCPILRNEEESTSAIYIALSHGATFLLDTLRIKESDSCVDSIMYARESCHPIVTDFSLHMSASCCKSLTRKELSRCFVLEGITTFMLKWKNVEKIASGELDKLMELAARFRLLLICDTSTVKKPTLAGKAMIIAAYLNKLKQLVDLAHARNVPVLFTNIVSHDELEIIFSVAKSSNKVYAALDLTGKGQFMERPVKHHDLPKLFENPDIILNPPELVTPDTDPNHFIENSKAASFLQEACGEFADNQDYIAMVSELFATRPAKLLGVYPQKGTLNPGSDADIIIWNPIDANIAKSIGSNTSLLRKDIWGVMLNGELISENQLMLSHTFNGRFIYRNSIIEETEPETASREF